MAAMSVTIPCLALLALLASSTACSPLQHAKAERPNNTINCASAFAEVEPLPTSRYPNKPFWRGLPNSVVVVTEPTNLDSNGGNEKIFIGEYVPSGGMLEHPASRLVIIGDNSELASELSPERLYELFNVSMGENSREFPVSDVERIDFSNFLENVALAPGGKMRNQGWSGRQYSQYFKAQGVLSEERAEFPPLKETRVTLVSYKSEPLMLLDATDDREPPSNDIKTDYRFLARYLGASQLQIICAQKMN